MRDVLKNSFKSSLTESRIPLRRHERSELIRNRIMSVAALMFYQKGYAATSLDDIAKEANINKAAVYYYFKAKSTLLYEICVKAAKTILDADRPIVDRHMPAEQKLLNLVTNHLQFQSAHKGYAGLGGTVEISYMPNILRKRYVGLRDDYEAMFRRVLKEGIGQGMFAPINVRLGSLFILGFLNSINEWHDPDGEITSEEMIVQAYRFILAGLEVKKPTNTKTA